jgi:hypothetical protein
LKRRYKGCEEETVPHPGRRISGEAASLRRPTADTLCHRLPGQPPHHVFRLLAHLASDHRLGDGGERLDEHATPIYVDVDVELEDALRTRRVETVRELDHHAYDQRAATTGSA